MSNSRDDSKYSWNSIRVCFTTSKPVLYSVMKRYTKWPTGWTPASLFVAGDFSGRRSSKNFTLICDHPPTAEEGEHVLAILNMLSSIKYGDKSLGEQPTN